MQLDEDTEESEGAPSEGGGAHPGRARLIPTFRLLSKSVMAKCKGDLEENDSVGVWSLDVSQGCPQQHQGSQCGGEECSLCHSVLCDQLVHRAGQQLQHPAGGGHQGEGVAEDQASVRGAEDDCSTSAKLYRTKELSNSFRNWDPLFGLREQFK